MIPTGIITISDRASAGVYPDQGGPGLREAVERRGWDVRAMALVPDDRIAIQKAVCRLCEEGCHLVLTTGGTGIGPRDVTPEALREIASREIPGFGEVMRRESIQHTPRAILSRSLAVTVGRTLVICLPGKPSGAAECLGFVAEAIPHCVALLQETPASC